MAGRKPGRSLLKRSAEGVEILSPADVVSLMHRGVRVGDTLVRFGRDEFVLGLIGLLQSADDSVRLGAYRLFIQFARTKRGSPIPLQELPAEEQAKLRAAGEELARMSQEQMHGHDRDGLPN